MSDQNKTPWLLGDVKPVRVGVYETDGLEEVPYYSYFDGVGFCGQWESVEQALEKAGTETRRAHLRKNGSPVDMWRGLTSPPKDKA